MEHVEDLDDLDDEERATIEANIAWLQQQDPDEWHRAALDFNWGEPLYVLDWIVRQERCDVATALHLFWTGEPEAWLEPDENEQPNGFSWLNRRLCAHVAERVPRGGYPRSEIAFEPDTWTRQAYLDLVAREQTLAAPAFRSTPDLILDRPGRVVENDTAFYRRYPEEFHDSVEMELPGWSAEADVLHARVLEVEEETKSRFPAWLRRR